MDTNERRRQPRRVNGLALLFPAVLVYYELLFRAFTVGGLFGGSGLVMLGFCCAYGGFGYLLSTISRYPRRNRRVAAALLVLTAAPYLVEIFVFEAFKVFYDLRTVLNGANDVLTGFTGDIVRLVFSVRGIGCILLYLLPGVLYGLFGGLLGDARPISGRARAMALARMAAFYVICLLAIHLSPALSRTYSEMYSFQPAVERFGFLTGLRLDIGSGASGPVRFEETAALPVAKTAQEPEQTAEDGTEAETGTEDGAEATEPSPTPDLTDYGYNQLDLPLDNPDGTESSDIRSLNAYVAAQTPSRKNAYTGLFKGKNLILISAEAFSGEVIDPELTPALYRLASKGIQFTDFFQPTGTGTTGGEYQNIFGLLPSNGGSSFTDIADNFIKLNMGTKLNELGYYGKAFHNNTYTYYDRDETHTTLGYSDGYMAEGNGMEQYVTHQWPQSDYEMFQGTVPLYIDKQPFSIYYMTVSGHGIYPIESNAMAAKNWDRVEDLPYSDEVKGYLAANLELEDAMAYLLEQLDAKGIADDTVICLIPDHFPYGLDGNAALGNMPLLSELYGYEVHTVFQRDHSCCLLWCGCLEDSEPIVVDEPTFSLDVLPTLLNLFGIDFDSRLLPGRDVFSDAPALVFDLAYDWKTPYGTYTTTGGFVPAEGVDEAEIPAGYEDDILAVVRNKINFCQGILNRDYYTYLFWR